ncbi:HNH endonuclease [Sulfurovum sp. NBC37-1]|uniref:HNH endonuclease n=1 Tax=Sulfurovum sp. (strain NBC37-1) TaxID=387093 RepID=UPI0001587B49|nr:HNH endonuclease [Sulfurovum sp. NBC37-1]BAF73368.1 5-methylcytosine-specific restriction enzyme A [Sulfurovum sp. NBC37-1]
MQNNWTKEELKAAVIAYIEMRTKSLNGESFKKKQYYEDLSHRFGRTIKSYEYRMQNISYVYSLMGRDWLKGLRPAKNVGTRVASEIEEIIKEIENQALSEPVSFQAEVDKLVHKKLQDKPKAVLEPKRYDIAITKYDRDPQIVAWVLMNAKGICECCNKEAPFVKDDGVPFLEVHHLRRLADDGSDSITNAIAICPNCHRELHYGQNKDILLTTIYSQVSRLIRE